MPHRLNSAEAHATPGPAAHTAQPAPEAAGGATSRASSAAAPSGVATSANLARVVRLLTAHATTVISGAKMADELGVTRSAVWRMVEGLRALGVAIAGHPATGYRLQEVPDLLLPETAAVAARGTIFQARIHHYFRVGSTNTAALQAAAEGAPEGTLFLAEEQTAGRGRGGHAWHSEPSTGIYMSAVLRPQLAPAGVLWLSLAAGLAVAGAVREVTGSACDLRWPNDVLLNGKKICGILAEMSAEATRVRHVVLGIGLNVNQQQFPPELQSLASSLRIECGRPCSRVELLAKLLKQLDRGYASLQAEAGGEEILREFEAASSTARDHKVRVEEDGGYAGTTCGLDRDGFLIVETATGRRRVLSGGVRALKEI